MTVPVPFVRNDKTEVFGVLVAKPTYGVFDAVPTSSRQIILALFSKALSFVCKIRSRSCGSSNYCRPRAQSLSLISLLYHKVSYISLLYIAKVSRLESRKSGSLSLCAGGAWMPNMMDHGDSSPFSRKCEIK